MMISHFYLIKMDWCEIHKEQKNLIELNFKKEVFKPSQLLVSRHILFLENSIMSFSKPSLPNFFDSTKSRRRRGQLLSLQKLFDGIALLLHFLCLF